MAGTDCTDRPTPVRWTSRLAHAPAYGRPARFQSSHWPLLLSQEDYQDRTGGGENVSATCFDLVIGFRYFNVKELNAALAVFRLLPLVLASSPCSRLLFPLTRWVCSMAVVVLSMLSTSLRAGTRIPVAQHSPLHRHGY